MPPQRYPQPGTASHKSSPQAKPDTLVCQHSACQPVRQFSCTGRQLSCPPIYSFGLIPCPYMLGLGHILWTWQCQQPGGDELIHLGPDPDWDSHCSLQPQSEHSTGPTKSLLLGLLSLTHHQHWSLLNRSCCYN